MIKTPTKALTLVAGVLLLGTVCQGEPTMLTTQVEFIGDDSLNWALLGPPSATPIAGPVAITSTSGAVDTIVANASGELMRLNQSDGWGGNFAPGAPLLTTAYSVGPLVIEFANPIAAAGAQIQRNEFGVFTATLEVFNAAGSRTGYFTWSGYSFPTADDSALFLGVRDRSPTIKKIAYSVDWGTADFAINRLRVLESIPHHAPGASLWGLIIAAGLLLAAAVRFAPRGTPDA